MRLILAPFAAATAALLLAGCALPGQEDEEPDDPLVALCPQWIHGPGQQTVGFVLPTGVAGNGSASGNGTAPPPAAVHEVELGLAAAEHQGRPLDVYRITLTRLDLDGRLSLRAFAADGTQLALRDYREPATQLRPVLVFTDGSAVDHEFDVALSAVAHGSTPEPAPVTLRWTLDGDSAEVGFVVSYHYKVCGADV